MTAHGSNALLRLAVNASAPAGLQAALTQVRGHSQVAVAVPAGKRTLTLALPKQLLAAGAYRLLVSASGPSGQTVGRTVVVHVPVHLKQS